MCLYKSQIKNVFLSLSVSSVDPSSAIVQEKVQSLSEQSAISFARTQKAPDWFTVFSAYQCNQIYF